MSLAGKTAIVTGATRGIGLAIASRFAKNGTQTFLIGRDRDRVAAVEEKFLQTYGEGHRGVVLDIGDKTQVDLVMKDLTKGAKVDYLVNAAGISRDALLIQMKENDLAETMNVNLLGTMRVTQHVVKAMIRKRQGGCIINVSSVIGINGNAGQTVYGASKAGIIGFTKSLAKEVGPSQIRVNAIAPGFIETDMTAALLQSEAKREALLNVIPLRRFGNVDDVADAAIFLANASYMHGQVLTIDGGLVI